jgi:hypothetical protein
VLRGWGIEFGVPLTAQHFRTVEASGVHTTPVQIERAPSEGG